MTLILGLYGAAMTLAAVLALRDRGRARREHACAERRLAWFAAELDDADRRLLGRPEREASTGRFVKR